MLAMFFKNTRCQEKKIATNIELLANNNVIRLVVASSSKGVVSTNLELKHHLSIFLRRRLHDFWIE